MQIKNHVVSEKRKVLISCIEDMNQLSALLDFKDQNGVLSGLAYYLKSAFAFVIVGEVKAGKSSFVNALLQSDREICPTGVAPVTDKINYIYFGEEETVSEVGENIKHISIPIPILQDIAIVDTPGTNTILKDHQAITEKFIPFADLIIFVFEAKNPYRQSSWDFLDFIKDDWGRKIIFVLQQKDLLGEEDLNTNREGLLKICRDKGISDPQIFSVSAKQEIEGLSDFSGFSTLRDYISQHYTGEKNAFKKLESNKETALRILDSLYQMIQVRDKQYEKDKTFRDQTILALDTQQNKTKQQINFLVEALKDSYKNIIHEKTLDLQEGLSVGSVFKRAFSAIFGNEKSVKEWLEAQANDLELKLNKRLGDKLNVGIGDVAENLQQMCRDIVRLITDNTPPLLNTEEVSEDIIEKRSAVLKELQESFAGFLDNRENFYDEQLFSETSKISPNLAAGSGIALIGVVLTALTNGAIFDITGGVLTAIGIGFAGVSIGLNRSKIIKHFKSETDKGYHHLEHDMTERLQSYADRIRFRIDQHFVNMDKLLGEEKIRIEGFKATYEQIKNKLQNI